jgi:hypothetical protein
MTILLSLTLLSTTTAADISKLDWMAGCHVLENAARGIKVEEQWMKPEGGLMMGINRTQRGGKAVAHEFLRIDAKGEVIVYTALIGTKNETPFKLTSQTDTEAVFENPEHDFPKRIIYRKTPDGIFATIDGGEANKNKHQDFPMKSVPCGAGAK